MVESNKNFYFILPDINVFSYSLSQSDYFLETIKIKLNWNCFLMLAQAKPVRM